MDRLQLQPKDATPALNEMAALFGEYAALSQHPGDEDDRLALAIRVVEALGMEQRVAN